MLKLTMKWTAPTLLACAVVTGCNANNKDAAKPQSLAAPSDSTLNIPATPPPPPAPPVAYTPAAPQPAYDEVAAEQPVIDEPFVDASDSVAPPAPRRSAPSGGTRYKVKKGDSLWSIAQARYGNGNQWKRIAAANPSIDPNRIQAGQTIVLP